MNANLLQMVSLAFIRANSRLASRNFVKAASFVICRLVEAGVGLLLRVLTRG